MCLGSGFTRLGWALVGMKRGWVVCWVWVFVLAVGGLDLGPWSRIVVGGWLGSYARGVNGGYSLGEERGNWLAVVVYLDLGCLGVAGAGLEDGVGLGWVFRGLRSVGRWLWVLVQLFCRIGGVARGYGR